MINIFPPLCVFFLCPSSFYTSYIVNLLLHKLRPIYWAWLVSPMYVRFFFSWKEKQIKGKRYGIGRAFIVIIQPFCEYLWNTNRDLLSFCLLVGFSPVPPYYSSAAVYKKRHMVCTCFSALNQCFVSFVVVSLESCNFESKVSISSLSPSPVLLPVYRPGLLK